MASQMDLILSYFLERPNENIPHAEVVDWAVTEWKQLTGKALRDPDRAVRSLHQQGILVKVSNGLYKYDPDLAHQDDEDEPFSNEDKQAIFARDGFKCRICGRGPDQGVRLEADHIKPRYKGGMSTVENGQTLCGEHNNRKKAFGFTEFGKNYYSHLLKLAEENGEADLAVFFNEILDVFKKYNLD